MIWWILTYLDNYRPPHTLGVLAQTNLQAHLFMKWAKTKPARRPLYKRVRGLNVWCGYEYVWDTPNLVEQSQPGNTFEHLFGNIPLAPTDHVWYYLFSIGQRPFKECQGPLTHVPPPELPMPAARIFHSVDQPCASFAFTTLTFDSVLFDDYGLYDPTQPTRLTAPAGALYAFGANARVVTGLLMSASISIVLNGASPIAYHDHTIAGPMFAGGRLSLHGIWPLQPGDYLTCRIYHTAGVPRDVVSWALFTPHFWIAQIGAYPITPP